MKVKFIQPWLSHVPGDVIDVNHDVMMALMTTMIARPCDEDSGIEQKDDKSMANRKIAKKGH